MELTEEEKFMNVCNKTYSLYFKHGPRSPNKVNYFHSEIIKILCNIFKKELGYEIKQEYSISACNSSGKKKCDIVVLKNEKPYIIIPVKIIMSNYKQNRNNCWENITGELTHIKWNNENINIVPVNIFMNNTPYLKQNKQIKHFEKITIDDIKIYDKLIKNNLCYDIINYIVVVEHLKNVGDIFDEIKPIKKIQTQYRTFESIFGGLL